MLKGMWRKENFDTLFVGMEKSMAVAQKLKLELSYGPAVPPLGTHPKKMKTVIQKRYMQPHFHGSIIYNSQHIEPTYVSIDGKWIKRMRYTYMHVH